MFGNHCINTGWWFQTWMEYFPFHIWDNPSHWLMLKPPTRINRNICIIIIYYYINTILLYYIYGFSTLIYVYELSMLIHIYLCFPMLFYAMIHVYHCASICSLPMIIYVYSSSHIQDDPHEVQSFHKQPSLLRISRGLGSIPTNTYHLGMVGWFFPSKKTNIPYLNGPLNMCKSSTFFHGFTPPKKTLPT